MTFPKLSCITSLFVLACLFSTAGAVARTYEDTAEMLFKSGHREDAVRVIGEAIKKRPKEGYLYATRGRYLLRGENYGLALDDLTKAMAIDPSFRQDWVYRMRADCHVNLGNNAAAISDLKKAIALKPQDEYYKMLGEVYYQLKRLDEAIDSFSKGIALNSKNYWLYKIRGDIFFQQKKYKKAVDDYTAVIRIMPNEPVGYGSRAKAYEKLGLHALADKDLARTKKDNDFMGELMK
jgi:tetratricopeptide (TPR) repeat protein